MRDGSRTDGRDVVHADSVGRSDLVRHLALGPLGVDSGSPPVQPSSFPWQRAGSRESVTCVSETTLQVGCVGPGDGGSRGVVTSVRTSSAGRRSLDGSVANGRRVEAAVAVPTDHGSDRWIDRPAETRAERAVGLGRRSDRPSTRPRPTPAQRPHDRPVTPTSRPTGTSRRRNENLSRTVHRALEQWSNQGVENADTYITHNLRGYIRRHLATSGYRRQAESISIPRRTTGCDLVVDDRVAVTIIYRMSNRNVTSVRKQLRAIFHEYDHLIVYGHQIPPQDLDQWRHLKRTLDRYGDERGTIRFTETIVEVRYRLPVTGITVSKTVLQRSIVSILFLSFVVTFGYFLEAFGSADVMARSYVVAVAVLNLVIVAIGAFLVKSL